MAGAAMLNRTGDAVRRELANQKDSTSPSKAAVIAPAAGPKSTAAAMLNVSEIEKLISIEGIRSMTQPVLTVRPARISQRASKE